MSLITPSTRMSAPYEHNTFNDCGDRLSKIDIDQIQDLIGVQIPPSLREHYLHCNGGQPQNRKWILEEEGIAEEGEVYYIVSSFISMDGKIDYNSYGLETIYLSGINEGWLPKNFLPFADDQGGNYFCVDLSSGHVVWYVTDIWDDEVSQAENVVAATTYVTSSFHTFVEGLVEEDDWDEDE